MNLRTKIWIASAVCVASFAASVVTTFFWRGVTGPLFLLGVVSGTRAAQWAKQLSPENRRPRGNLKLPRLLGWLWWFFYALLTLSLFYLGTVRFYHWQQFKQNGVAVSAVLVGKEEIENNNRAPTYLVAYRYTVAGQSFEVRKAVDSRTYQGLTRGTVPIKYLPFKPSDSRIDIDFETEEEGGSAFEVECIGLVFLGFGIWGFYNFLTKPSARPSRFHVRS